MDSRELSEHEKFMESLEKAIKQAEEQIARFRAIGVLTPDNEMTEDVSLDTKRTA